MTDKPTFGARYRALPTARERLQLDEDEGRRTAFAEVDAALDRLVLGALQGEHVVDNGGAVSMPEADRTVLTGWFSAERRQERGAWYVPKLTNLATGHISLVHWWQKAPRYALSLAGGRLESAGRANAARQANTDLVVIWAVLEPIFEELALPLMLRSGRMAGGKTTEKQLPYWAKTIEPVYEALGSGMEAVRHYAPGTGWGDLDADGVLARRDALLACWADADLDTARRLRAHRIGQLVERYYSKTKNGRAARKRVVNSDDFERTLTAYFGGDWLAFLDYLGEQPAAGEELTTSLPDTRLTATTSDRVAAVAAEHGLPAEEVERMLASFWSQSNAATPVEQRLRVLEELWAEFDSVHARQAPNMPTLYGLLSTSLRSGTGEPRGESTREDRVFSAALLTDLAALWETKLSLRAPERLVTERNCSAAAARAFGPALTFWHELAMSAWELCEGRRFDGDLDGLERTFRKMTEALTATGFPVDARLFEDLRAAGPQLGPIEQEWDTVREETEGLLTMSMQVSRGGRRDGFEILRDIITRNRRAWAEQHLTAYLAARWRSELQAVGQEYHRHLADKGKAPTVKQFAAMADAAANHWFGGDLNAVYGAIGLPSPVGAPAYERLLPADNRDLVRAVCNELRADVHVRGTPGAVEGSTSSATEFNQNTWFLGQRSFRWVELAEALGQDPTLKQFGTHDVTSVLRSLGDDPDAAWQTYCQTVRRVLARPVEATKPANNGQSRTTRANTGTGRGTVLVSAEPSYGADNQAGTPKQDRPQSAGSSTQAARAATVSENPAPASVHRLLRRLGKRH